MEAELLKALKDAVQMMRDEEDNQERDVFGFGCPNCDGAVPTSHSPGCKLLQVIHKAEKRAAAPADATATRNALLQAKAALMSAAQAVDPWPPPQGSPERALLHKVNVAIGVVHDALSRDGR